MPLINSPSNEAREKNIETEIAAGKDPKQAVAIGYSVQRRAGGGKDEFEVKSEDGRAVNVVAKDAATAAREADFYLRKR